MELDGGIYRYDGLDADTILSALNIPIFTATNGNEKFKTIGKLLDEKVTLEGKYTIVLKTVVQDGRYYFATHNSGQDTVKTPIGMFDADLIPNDLVAVDKVIREYYGMEEL